MIAERSLQTTHGWSRRTLTCIASILLPALAVTFVSASQQHAPSSRSPVVGVPAAAGILALFDEYRLVGVGENHAITIDDELILSLIDQPGFAQAVDDVVIEMGNALYQDVLDRYIRGEDVPRSELVHVWRDTTQCISGVGDSPFYDQLLGKIRALNLTLPDDERIRVLAADPPIDWSKIKSMDDYQPFSSDRDPHFARVLRKVLAAGRRGLIITGSAHVQKSPIPDGADDIELGAGQLVERSHPGALFAIHPCKGKGLAMLDLLDEFAAFPVPALVRIKGTKLPDLDLAPILTGNLTWSEELQKMVPMGQGELIGNRFDAFLYFGPPESITRQYTFPPTNDPRYQAEVKRRRKLLGLGGGGGH